MLFVLPVFTFPVEFIFPPFMLAPPVLSFEFMFPFAFELVLAFMVVLVLAFMVPLALPAFMVEVFVVVVEVLPLPDFLLSPHWNIDRAAPSKTSRARD